MAALFLALHAGAVALRGQTGGSPPPSPWQLTAFGGWYSGATPYVVQGAPSVEVRLDDCAEYGLRLGYDFSRAFGLEIAWTHASPNVTPTGGSAGAFGQRQLNTYEVDGNFYLTRGTVRGFLMVGTGGANTGSSFGGVNFTASAGLGVKIFFDRRFALRLQGMARSTYGNLGEGDTIAYCDRFGCYNYRSTWYWSGEAFGGVTFAF